MKDRIGGNLQPLTRDELRLLDRLLMRLRESQVQDQAIGERVDKLRFAIGAIMRSQLPG